MKTPLKEAIENIRNYRDLGTSDYDTCNTILLHLASLLEQEKQVIIDAFNEEDDVEFYTTEEITELVDTVCKGYYAGREWNSKEQEEAIKASFKVGYTLALRHFKK